MNVSEYTFRRRLLFDGLRRGGLEREPDDEPQYRVIFQRRNAPRLGPRRPGADAGPAVPELPRGGRRRRGLHPGLADQPGGLRRRRPARDRAPARPRAGQPAGRPGRALEAGRRDLPAAARIPGGRGDWRRRQGCRPRVARTSARVPQPGHWGLGRARALLMDVDAERPGFNPRASCSRSSRLHPCSRCLCTWPPADTGTTDGSGSPCRFGPGAPPSACPGACLPRPSG